MSAISSFTTLKNALEAWLARSDITGQLEDFIRFAELDIYRRLRTEHMLVSTSSTLSGSTIAKPSRFIAPRFLYLTYNNRRYPLHYRTPEAMAAEYPLETASRPKVFTIDGTSIEVRPSPDYAYSYTLAYYQREEYLSDTNPTNWMTGEATDLLLYGSLIQAEPYLENDPRLATWQSMYEKALNALELHDMTAKYSTGSLETKSEYYGG